MEGSPDASLLSIPRELRLQIYEHLYSADVNYCPISQWRDNFKLKADDQPHWGFNSQPERNSNAHLALPWMSLSLTCKSIHNEIEAYVDSLSSRTRNRKPDFVVDLRPVGVGGGFLGSVTWREIRTSLDKVGVLQANIDASRGFRQWGVGGPNPVLRGLYQALNYFIHCGPRMDSSRQLSKPVHLKELIVNIHHSDGTAGQLQNGKELSQAFFTYLGRVVQAGILNEYVEKVVVKSGDCVLEQPVPQGEPQEVPTEWDGYGFQWTLEKN